MNMLFKAFITIFTLSLSSLFAKTTFYHNDVKNANDKRMLYEIEILKLALDKTVKKYGKYKLLPTIRMTKRRAIEELKKHKIKNFILKISVKKEYLNKFAHANFPVDRGISGYRVSFISPKIKKIPELYNSLKKIKKLDIAQGIGWLDTEILKYNGFNVKTIGGYDYLFNLVAIGRIDLFPRSPREVILEYNTYGKNVKNLVYDKTFILRYDFPRFFFANKADKKAIKRIEEGLKIAYKDGSFQKIYNKYHKKSIKILKNRKIYNLENPFIKGIDSTYKKYNINIR